MSRRSDVSRHGLACDVVANGSASARSGMSHGAGTARLVAVAGTRGPQLACRVEGRRLESVCRAAMTRVAWSRPVALGRGVTGVWGRLVAVARVRLDVSRWRGREKARRVAGARKDGACRDMSRGVEKERSGEVASSWLGLAFAVARN